MNEEKRVKFEMCTYSFDHGSHVLQVVKVLLTLVDVLGKILTKGKKEKK